MDAKQAAFCAKRVARYTGVALTVYQVLQDQEWHASRDLERAAMASKVAKTILRMRMDGLPIDSRPRAFLPGERRHSPMYEYRLAELIPKEIADKAAAQWAIEKNSNWTRTHTWFVGARAGLAAAQKDKLNGTVTPNPYRDADMMRAFVNAYKAFMEEGRDLTKEFVERPRKIKKRTRASRRALKFTMNHTRDALYDFEMQAKGYTLQQNEGGKTAKYLLDPSLTDEDKEFAERQAAICRRELKRQFA